MDRDDRANNRNRSTRCRHQTTEWLGVNNRMEFLRCLTCRAVIVTQGGTTLAIPPARMVG